MTVEIGPGTGRFALLLSETTSHAADHDRPLLARPDWLVAPTLGAIVPGWLLLIARSPALSFRDWKETHGQRPEDVLCEIRAHLGLAADEIIWFEHGPAIAGTKVGCGLDHAHIHILVRPEFAFETFAEQARGLTDLAWTRVPANHAYEELERGVSYLIAGCGDAAIAAARVEAAGSQFFRRVVGSLSGGDNSWDYRRHPHPDHIDRTIKTFKSLERATLRGE